MASSAIADSSGVDPPMSPHASEAAPTEMELPSPSPSPRRVRYSEHTVSSDVASPVSEIRRRGMSMHDVGLPRKLSFAKGTAMDSLVKTTRMAANVYKAVGNATMMTHAFDTLFTVDELMSVLAKPAPERRPHERHALIPLARKAFPFLADPFAPPGLVELVAAQLQLCTFEEGQVVYRQGEASSREWYYVIEGAAEHRRDRIVVDEASTPPPPPSDAGGAVCSSDSQEHTHIDAARQPSSDAMTPQSASPTSSFPSAPPTTNTPTTAPATARAAAASPRTSPSLAPNAGTPPKTHTTKSSPVGTPVASVKSTDGASAEASSAEQEALAQEGKEEAEEAQEVTALLPQESTFGLDMAPLEELVKSFDQEETMEEARRRALVLTAGRKDRSERGSRKGLQAYAQAGLLEKVNPDERQTTVVATERTQCAVFSLALYTAALAELSALPAKGYLLRFLLERPPPQRREEDLRYVAIELASRFTLFSKMPEALRMDVCKLASLSVIPKHSVLYRKGDDANKSFLLMDGTVSMWRTPTQESSGGGLISPPGTPRSVIGGVSISAAGATTPSRTSTRHSVHEASRVVLDQPIAAAVTEGLEYDYTVMSGPGAEFGEQPIRTTRAVTAATDETLCVVVMISAAAYQSVQKRHHQTVMRERAAFLANTLCFRSVSTVTLAHKYAPLFSLETHSRGHVILAPGKVAERIYFIEEGECQLGAPVELLDRDAERVPPDPITGGTMKLNPLRLNPAPAVMPVSLLHMHDAFGAISALKERPQRFTITAVSPVVRILSISVKDVRAHIASKTVTNLIRVAKKQDSLRVHLVGSVLDARRQLAEKRRETVVGSEAFQRSTRTALPQLPVMLAKVVHQYPQQCTLETVATDLISKQPDLSGGHEAAEAETPGAPRADGSESHGASAALGCAERPHTSSGGVIADARDRRRFTGQRPLLSAAAVHVKRTVCRNACKGAERRRCLFCSAPGDLYTAMSAAAAASFFSSPPSSPPPSSPPPPPFSRGPQSVRHTGARNSAPAPAETRPITAPAHVATASSSTRRPQSQPVSSGAPSSQPPPACGRSHSSQPQQRPTLTALQFLLSHKPTAAAAAAAGDCPTAAILATRNPPPLQMSSPPISAPPSSPPLVSSPSRSMGMGGVAITRSRPSSTPSVASSLNGEANEESPPPPAAKNSVERRHSAAGTRSATATAAGGAPRFKAWRPSSSLPVPTLPVQADYSHVGPWARSKEPAPGSPAAVAAAATRPKTAGVLPRSMQRYQSHVEKAKKQTYLGYDQQQLTEIILGCSMNCDSGMDLMARAAGSLDGRSWTHSPSVRMDVSVPFHSKRGFRLSRGWT